MFDIIVEILGDLLFELFIDAGTDEKAPKWFKILFNLAFWGGLGTVALFGAIKSDPDSMNYLAGVIVLSMLAGVCYTIGLGNIVKIFMNMLLKNGGTKSEI